MLQKLIFLAAVLASAATLTQAADTPKARSTPVSLAVFDFEIEDALPAEAQVPVQNAEWLKKVTQSAREELTKSGRYRIIDATGAATVSTAPEGLHKCDGCESGLAQKLGARQSLLGIVGRATEIDYYITLVIRDADTGKMLDLQSANFIGGQEGWPEGARALIRHQLLEK